MKLAISNISWDPVYDETMYQYLSGKEAFKGLEIAPTRIFPDHPYDNIPEAVQFADRLFDRFGLEICSIQSIWSGREEQLFRSKAEREILFNYTMKAIDFASSIHCGNLVFGCPKNRNVFQPSDYHTALKFFEYLGEYALKKNTVLSLEANPRIYHTNFLNYTADVFDFVKHISSGGLGVNVDLGTIIQNQEDIQIIAENLDYVNHIHISEPGLGLIKKRPVHSQLGVLLSPKYDRYVSIEMMKQNDIHNVCSTIQYLEDEFYAI